MFNRFCLNLLVSKYTLRQVLLGSIGFSRGAMDGGVYACSKLLLSQLENNNSLVVTEQQSQWLKTMTISCIVLSALLSSILIQILGRQKTMIVMDSLILTAFLLIFLCKNISMLITACILYGTGVGTHYSTYLISMGEVSPPQFRTSLLTLPNIGAHIGFFLCKVLNNAINLRIFCAVCACVCIYNVINNLYLEESFVTYLDQDNIEKASQSYYWFRGNNPQSEEEFTDILNVKKRTKTNTYYQKLKQCNTREFLTPFCITVVVYISSKFSGVQAIVYCTQEIIQEINKEPGFLYNALTILSVVRILTIISSLFIVKISSPRFMSLFSGYMLSVSLLALGGFLYCTKIYQNSVFPILALIALVINVILFCLGLGAFAPVFCGEMFPYTTRTVGISIGIALTYLLLILFGQVLPALIMYVGGYGTMTMFGFCTFFSVIVLHLTLPYTKDKTLLDISRYY